MKDGREQVFRDYVESVTAFADSPHALRKALAAARASHETAITKASAEAQLATTTWQEETAYVGETLKDATTSLRRIGMADRIPNQLRPSPAAVNDSIVQRTEVQAARAKLHDVVDRELARRADEEARRRAEEEARRRAEEEARRRAEEEARRRAEEEARRKARQLLIIVASVALLIFVLGLLAGAIG